MTEEAKTEVEIKPVDESKAYAFIEKAVQEIEDSVDEDGAIDFDVLEALQREGQGLLDEKETIEDYSARISKAINENKLDTARVLINRMEEEIGKGTYTQYWRASLAWSATVW